MKKYQKYSKELKQEIVNRYWNGESGYKLAKEYDLSVAALVYQWANVAKKYERCKVNRSDKLVIENQYLKKQLKIKEKELQKEKLRG